MKKTEMIGVILSIVGLLFLMYDVNKTIEWTFWSFVGLGCAIPGIVLLVTDSIKNKN
jgi:formate-dependent nitrite reductase membrane component NrfD